MCKGEGEREDQWLVGIDKEAERQNCAEVSTLGISGR